MMIRGPGAGEVNEVGSEARLKEIENRLREVEGRLLDAASQTARFGLFSSQLDAQLRGVRELIDAVEAHLRAVAAHRKHPNRANGHAACTPLPAEDGVAMRSHDSH